MTKKTPHGPDHLKCPLWRKSMAKVCHHCPWWTEVRGSNPQTGEDASDWQCAITWGPMLAINIAQQARQTGAAVESFRNASVQSDINMANALTQIAKAALHGTAEKGPLLEAARKSGEIILEHKAERE